MLALSSEPQFPGFLHSPKMMGMHDQQALTLWELETPLNLRWKLQMSYTCTEIHSPLTKNAKIQSTLRPSCLQESTRAIVGELGTCSHVCTEHTLTAFLQFAPHGRLRRGQRLSLSLNR